MPQNIIILVTAIITTITVGLQLGIILFLIINKIKSRRGK